ncbi:MAG TPA: glycosyltransferase, partial [Terriglobales bacterium]|nr:glycosyltransferase [Terriglobales bacterium]
MSNRKSRQVCIGVHVHAEPQKLLATLAAVRAHTRGPYELVLLPDGSSDLPTQALLKTLTDYPQCATAGSVGPAACFNRLADYSKAKVIVLLESGARVGPGWLEHLLRGLNAEAQNGLAGPSTNSGWNEQGAFPEAGDTDYEIARIAERAETSFGQAITTLEPLYSLADFCYAVRREVIAAVGAADENYALGPCWEMDYNIRAARAGWRGVWVKAAYVHRAPFTLRRRIEEARRFDASKRLYQDKFCGARLRGEKHDYRSHCRGDACANFAPANLIEIKRAFGSARPLSVYAASPRVATQVPATASVSNTAPLVSCIMPTFNRRQFVPQAIRCFFRQSYPNLELLVIDDGTDGIGDCVPQSERVRYLRLAQKLTIGAKRNFACEQAAGEFIVHWDDDDWYPPDRVTRQIEPLLNSRLAISGSSRTLYYEIPTGACWEYRYPTANGSWVAGNTLAYRTSFWAQHRFPEIQVGEDSRFVWGSGRNVIHDLADPELCVATAHGNNTSPKDLKGAYWHRQSDDRAASLLGDELYFYQRSAEDAPLVSCIMPTYNRRAYLPQALQSFRQQDYPNRELIVVDDGTEPIADLVADDQRIRLVR